MKRSELIRWVLVLLAAAACGTTPTPPPTATTPAPTSLPATRPASTATVAATAGPGTQAAPSDTPGGVASDTPTPAATDEDINAGLVTPVAAGEVVKLSGDSFATSDIYRFSADTTLDIRWTYTGTAPFALWLINASENVTDPQYDRILVDDVTGPHAGSAQTKIIAGDWTVQVEQGEGPWTVEFKPES